ncbi:MAG: aldo/keto reductase [Hydrogenophaga sp.]|nr:aldo/keto reductase [Hydrogenophaga sp.]
MRRVPLGSSGIEVSALGLGCYGMSHVYGHRDEAESIEAIRAALDHGIDLIDTADFYGRGHNETLVGTALQGRRERAVLCSKFGYTRDAEGRNEIRGDAAYVREACEASLKRLGVDVIDLYYMHRLDLRVPVEETVGAMADLVRAGKVRFLGLSEISSNTLQRAAAVHPIAAVQSEYSLWSRDPEERLLGTCEELGVTFVGYAVLGRGFLTGKVRSLDDLPPDDGRRKSPRFYPENFQRNIELVHALERMSQRLACTPAQLALAWVMSRPRALPLFGAERREFLAENAGAVNVRLSTEDLAEIDAAMPPGAASGARYDADMMSRVEQD